MHKCKSYDRISAVNAKTDLHLKHPRSTATVELDEQVYFVVPLVDFKDSLFPFSGPQLPTSDADADSATLVSLGTVTAMRARGAQNSGSGHNWWRTDAARDLQQSPDKRRETMSDVKQLEMQKRTYNTGTIANTSDEVFTTSGSKRALLWTKTHDFDPIRFILHICCKRANACQM